MQEEDWLAHLLERFHLPAAAGILGPGDDAAVFSIRAGETVVATVDALVEGTHFQNSWLSDRELGGRAIAVSLSDLAAMGAEPRGALLAIQARELPGRFTEQFWDGVAEMLAHHHCPLLGGNVTRIDGPAGITSTLLGSLPSGSELRRDGARAGDQVWVTGRPGNAARARALCGQVRADDAGTLAWRCVQPRVAEGIFLRQSRWATAAIDVSDGLGQDLSRLLRASGAGARIELAPLLLLEKNLTASDVLDGGEDYELLFSARADSELQIVEFSKRFQTSVTRIGTVTTGHELVVTQHGQVLDYRPRGWDPFRDR